MKANASEVSDNSVNRKRWLTEIQFAEVMPLRGDVATVALWQAPMLRPISGSGFEQSEICTSQIASG